MPKQQRAHGQEDEPLLVGQGGHGGAPHAPPSDVGYSWAPRQWRDVNWLVAYVLVLVGALAGGVAAFVNRNPHFLDLVAPAHLNDPASCPAGAGRSLLQDEGDKGWRFDALMVHGAMWSGVTVCGSLGVAAGFLLLLRRSARMLVATAIVLQVMLPTLGAFAAFANGAVGGGLSLLLLSGLLVLLFSLWREQIELVTHLLGMAGHALLQNMGLVGVALGLQMGMLLMALPLVAGIAMAITNGQVAYNPARADAAPAAAPAGVDDDAKCFDEEGNAVFCCVWQLESWVPFYITLGVLALMWTTFLAFEIKVFTVSGAVSQWYFAPLAPAHSAGQQQQGSPALRSLRHALGPSLGSLCFGSAVLTLMSLLRQSLQKAREEARNNIFFWLIATVLDFVYALIEFLTKFSTVRMAMTGEAFVNAGRGVVDLLARNAMDAFGVWWLPPLILQNCALVAALCWGFVMWGIGGAQFRGEETGPASAVALGGIAFLAGWAVLSFFCALLLNVVDAVFVCVAVDRDMHAVTHVEVHEVVSKLPTVGPVVENPGGHVVYGHPQTV